MSEDLDRFLSEYRTRWNERALVRNKRSKWISAKHVPEDFFPIGRQLLTSHLRIMELPEEPVAQSSFNRLTNSSNMNDIAMTEMDPVIDSSMRIASEGFSFRFPAIYKDIALTVAVDESYHALVTRDYMEEVTEIKPLSMRDGVDIITVSIAENTLTRDVEAASASPDGNARAACERVESEARTSGTARP